jgi:putative SOS response-associated peptidase YedK
MCGRFLLLSAGDELSRLLSLAMAPGLKPRYNIAPTQQIPAARAADAGRECINLRWGFIPSWSKDGKLAPINAMSETAPDKPMFRTAFRKRRCLIPATGFYEWKATPGVKRKQPYAIRLADDKPFAFAGLWEKWAGPDGDVETCCILTTAPNELIGAIHNRMPVIMHPRDFDQWLDPKEQDAASVAELLRPFPAEKMRAFSVSTWVNDVKHQDARCIEPAA